MPIEKDFSPTLAGSERSRGREMIIEWLTRVPELIRASVPEGTVRVGLKLFNSLEDDTFQSEILSHVHDVSHVDFLVYANRLFDPEKTFDGQRGIAYGGPDLSDRNLRMLDRLRALQRSAGLPSEMSQREISGTGDILSGRMAMEYAMRGCSSFQLHTLFQLPAEEFPMRRGDRLERALHRLYFDPRDGLIVWLQDVGDRLGLRREGTTRFLDVCERAWRLTPPVRHLDS
jgi:hypothetical protein